MKAPRELDIFADVVLNYHPVTHSRAYCRIDIASAHHDTLGPILENWGFSEDGYGDGVTSFADCEANYGGRDTITDLQTKALPFTGHHDAGGEYGAEVFAFDGSTYVEAWSHEGDPVCVLAEDGELKGLETAKEYWQVYRAAQTAMEAASTEPASTEPDDGSGKPGASTIERENDERTAREDATNG